MSSAIEILFAAPRVPVLLGLGFVASGAVLAAKYRRSQGLSLIADELLDLAKEGRADQARIKARGAPRALGPILNALSGSLEAHRRRPFHYDLPWLLVLALPPILLVLNGLASARYGSALERSAAVGGLAIALSLLFPFTLAAAAGVLANSRQVSRKVRAVCVHLLQRNVRAQIDKERSEALRRGHNNPGENA